jgi:hypothetical protein
MWKWKHFDSLDGLLNFVNEHGLEHYQFKIVNSPAPRRSSPYGAPMYLVYRDHRELTETPELAVLAGLPLEAEVESAVETAEEIIQDAAEHPERR